LQRREDTDDVDSRVVASEGPAWACNTLHVGRHGDGCACRKSRLVGVRRGQQARRTTSDNGSNHLKKRAVTVHTCPATRRKAWSRLQCGLNDGFVMTGSRTMLCHHCKAEIKVQGKVFRSEECPSCGYDVYCCLNCSNYDPSAHNRCREPLSEWVSDREKANFC